MPQHILSTPQKEVKLLLILGPNFYISQDIKKLYDQEDCYILNSAKEDIFNIKGVLSEKNLFIGPQTRIDINTHGVAYRSTNVHKVSMGKVDFVFTQRIFETLRAASNVPLYVHLWSCYGRFATYNDVKGLGLKSILVTHSDKENSSSRKLSNYTFYNTIRHHVNTKKLSYKQQFIHDLPFSFEKAALAQVQDDGTVKTFATQNIIEDYDITKMISMLKQYPTAERMIYDELNKNQQEFYKVFPQSKETRSIEFDLTPSQIQDYFIGQLISETNNEKFKDNTLKDIQEFIRLSKEKGVNFNHEMPLQPLLFYSISKSPKLFMALITEGEVNRNTKNIHGHTPLSYVIKNDENLKVIEPYLALKATSNQDFANETLMLFIEHGNNLSALNRSEFSTESFIELLDSDKATAEFLIKNGG